MAGSGISAQIRKIPLHYTHSGFEYLSSLQTLRCIGTLTKLVPIHYSIHLFFFCICEYTLFVPFFTSRGSPRLRGRPRGNRFAGRLLHWCSEGIFFRVLEDLAAKFAARELVPLLDETTISSLCTLNRLFAGRSHFADTAVKTVTRQRQYFFLT